MSRLDIGIKPEDVKFPEITKGLTYFVPPAGKILDLPRLRDLLKQSGYKLRVVRLELEGILDLTRKELRIPESGQVFALSNLPEGQSGSVVLRATWNVDDSSSAGPKGLERVVLRVEAVSSAK